MSTGKEEDKARSAGSGPAFPLPEGPAAGKDAVTVVTVVRNEEKNLADCLRRLDWVDRILLIDHGSTDRTAGIASKFTRWIVPGKDWADSDPVHRNLNLGFELVPEGWILHLDADERVSRSLAEEVRAMTAAGAHTAYRIPIRTLILGRWMEHGYWGEHVRWIRLFRAGKARYPLRAVHEELMVDGTLGALKSALHHLTYPSISEFYRKADLYTSREVGPVLSGESYGISGLGRRAARPSSLDLLRATARVFLWAQFRCGGWKGGSRGTATSLMLAAYSLEETLKAWERAEGLDRIPSIPED